MKIKNAQFLISAPDLKLCPQLPYKEFALLGRSNVGKSSFINKITNNSRLAKTSNTPGKTRLINLFTFNENAQGEKPFVIADMPGYGWAKVSHAEQNRWQKAFEEYLLKRENLACAIHFIDARHEIQKNDFQMHDWLCANSVPYFCVLAKCDYISRNEIAQKIKTTEKYFEAKTFPFSTKTAQYTNDILKYIEELI